MTLLKIIRYLRSNLKRLICFCLGVLALIVVADAAPNIVDKEHAHTWVETNIPGFWALFGLVGCIFLILISKWFGHRGIMQREDYYDE